MRIRRRYGSATLCFLLITCILPIGTATAQDAPARSGGALEALNPLQQIRQSIGGTSASLTLEGVVDPDEYVIGPGDEFRVSIGGAIPIQATAQVGADGILSVPDLGGVALGGKTLREAETEVERLLRTMYANVPISVSLAKPRQFFVHVSGAVPRPGRYRAVPAARVSDVLEEAYNSLQGLFNPTIQPGTNQEAELLSITSERPQLASGYRASFRNVTIIRRDGSQRSVDLYQYFATGNTEHNPYVLDGDVLVVDSYHLDRDAVRVSGAVAAPGLFPYRPDDTAMQVLRLAVSKDELASIGEIRITRRGAGGSAEVQTLDLNAVRAGTAADVPLQPGDNITVADEASAYARINGAVKHPGTYPIIAGETTLKDLLDVAGGLTDDANLSASFINREESMIFKADGRASDLDFFSRAYLAESRRENRLVVDLGEALRNDGTTVVLQNRDHVVIPGDDQTVYVTGNVPRPGYIPYEPGRSAGYYIELAGGMAPDSRDVYVFGQNTGAVTKGRNATVTSGMTIFVDRKPVPENPEIAQMMLADEAQRRQARIARTQTIITGISAITSIITAYVAITR